MRQNQFGSIVVETIGSFILFVLMVISILSLINIVTLQARLHYALTQSAEALAVYCYVLEVTGTADHLISLNERSNRVRVSAADFTSSMEGIIKGAEELVPDEIGAHEQAALNIITTWPDDPQETLQLLLSYGLDEAKNAVLAELIIRPLVGKYLSNGIMNGDEYLKSVNVRDGLAGLVFYSFEPATNGAANSQLIDENGDIKLVVRYEVDYMFGALPLPFAPRLGITQTAKTKAWLGGSGEGYPK